MISAYAISGKVWIVRTDVLAADSVPETLPIGSLVLTPEEAAKIGRQLLAAAGGAQLQERKRVQA